jgi:hypothetical protein
MWCREHSNNLVMNLGRTWRASWVCGEGRVDRAGSTTSREDKSYRRVLPRRSPCEMHVAGNVIGRGPRVECLHGMKPRDGRCCEGTGCQVSHRAGNGYPL